MSLDHLTKDIQKGIQGIGLRSQIQPSVVIHTCETITNGDSEEITHLMRDIGGESFSMAVGQTSMGADALDALGQAQAMSLVFLRNSKYASLTSQNIAMLVNLLDQHQKTLTHWIKTGVDKQGGAESDLSQIGLLINDPTLRLAAMSFYVSVTQVLSSSLSLFIHADQDDQD